MKIRPLSQLPSAALLCVALAACSFDERIADHAIEYNKTVEEANNSLILLNILRAKDRLPLHFTAFSQVRGKLTLKSTGSLGLTIPFGGDAGNTFPLTPKLELSQTSSPSFDVAILDTKEFMRGILSPIEKSVFEFYWHQRWPREVLLYLFIHKVDITYDPWKKNRVYPAHAKILENDLIWTTVSGGTSRKGEPNWGSKPGHEETDANITWKALYKADPWAAETLYRAGTTVLENDLIWQSSRVGTSGTVINEPTWVPPTATDNGFVWTARPIKTDPWAASNPYQRGDNILENGLIWTAVSDGTSRKGEPDWTGKVPGGQADDNEFKWTALTVTSKQIEPWAKSTQYKVGTTILENGLVWRAESTGQSGKEDKNEPVWTGKKPGDPAQAPGTKITWKALGKLQPPPVNSPPHVDTQTGKIKIDPVGEARFQSFQNWVTDFRNSLDFGTSKTGRPIGAGLELDDEAVLEHLVEAEIAQLRLVGIPKDKPTHYRLCKIATSVILCVGECPKSNPKKDCREGTTIAPTEADDLAIAAEEGKTVVAHLRSVDGILYYLGEVLRYQERSEKEVIIDRAVGRSKKLFDLTTENEDLDSNAPIISVEYNNNTWYVPTEGNKGGRTKTVLALVLQLLGLHKSSKELPTTTAVETVGGSP